MKKLVGLFILSFSLIALHSSSLSAQISSDTYERVKASVAPETAPVAHKHKKGKKDRENMISEGYYYAPILTIGVNEELTFPANMTECKVYDNRTLERAVVMATWKGTCEWIVLRNPTDLDPSAPLYIQLDKPLLLEDMDPSSKGRPLVITNDTGRAILFKTPKNGGCAVIVRKPNPAIMGFTFEGAICR